MVSFSCENCGDVLTKKKLDSHRSQCYGASFTCLDCMVHFHGTEYRAHTSCISEAQKYQGALYRPEKEKKGRNNSSNQNHSQALVQHTAYVEDAEDEYIHNSHTETVEPLMPKAPSPPSAAPGFTLAPSPVNVFDFLVAGSTPNQSCLELPATEPMQMIEDNRDEDMESNHERDLVRVRFKDAGQSVSDLVEYGNEPVATEYRTPAPKAERERERKKDKKERERTREEKKDKKRKRLHVETQDLAARDDESMTDAPPVQHSGLTGGLGRLLSRPSVFPPSPDYSGGDAGDASPGSPLKKSKTKTQKRGRVDTISNNLMSLISTKRVSSREHSEDRPKRKHRKHRESSERPARKMIEYTSTTGDAAADKDGQLVVYKPRAELLLSFINKGPESERGVSMNKALKRYHRERAALTAKLGKQVEEKELWRSLRMKKNDRGEIVLFW
ncbi:hypothetical protein QTJ16_002146 [Diplocarpon rosae]|uniref:Zinc finger C2H2 LYAR-type domain-containing protein n=1 Tax=Diplocarpon rosae TaxID=946125 RepID=A0AAD9WG98_9HELO|nr:hypothetical protein QTJ16_002146 [Diplocarpon rosae]PBP18047.1 LYAR-type C2HC zinc finger protein [Diplocarpon rosae]